MFSLLTKTSVRKVLLLGFSLSITLSIFVIVSVSFLLSTMYSTYGKIVLVRTIRAFIELEHIQLLSYLSGQGESLDDLSKSHQQFLYQFVYYPQFSDDSRIQSMIYQEAELTSILLDSEEQFRILASLASAQDAFRASVKEHIGYGLPVEFLDKIREEQLLLDTFDPTRKDRDAVISRFQALSDEVLSKLTQKAFKEEVLTSQKILRDKAKQIFILKTQIFDTVLPRYADLLRDADTFIATLGLDAAKKAQLLFIFILIILIIAAFIQGVIGIVSTRHATSISAQLEQKNRELNRLTRVMTHELRSPLTIISGYAQEIFTSTKGKTREDVSIIIRMGKYLLGLIKDTLDLSKIETGEVILSPEMFSLRDTVNTIVNNFLHLAKEKKLALVAKIDLKGDKLYTDKTKFEQIIINLVSNAVKFTKKGSIQIHSRIDGNWLVTDVIDTGIGIKEEFLPELFKEFSKLHIDEEEKYEGTGLGLSISKRLANILGGDITVQSTVGKGSTFTLRIPLLKPLE